MTRTSARAAVGVVGCLWRSWPRRLQQRGASHFPTYERLGVGTYQMTVSWPDVAPWTRPRPGINEGAP